jgi:DNA-binding GntR family transcriptional regulator
MQSGASAIPAVVWRWRVDCKDAGMSPSRSVRKPKAAEGAEAASSAPLSDAQMHQRIVGALLDQRLAPGTRLREDELGQVFGVSRTRIRQVLIRLASEQLVTLVPNAGARVAEPTPAEAREVFEVRRLVEPTLVAGFIEHANASALRALQRFITQEEAARAADQRHEAIRMAGGFHLHIAEHAGNATLARMLRELTSRTSLVLMRYGPQDLTESEGGAGCNCHEHRAILAAIKLRDKAAAGRLVVKHLDRLEAQLDFEPAAEPRARLADVLALSA